MQKQIKEMVAAEIAKAKEALKDAVRKELMELEPFKTIIADGPTIIADGPTSTIDLVSAVCSKKEEFKEESISEIEEQILNQAI